METIYLLCGLLCDEEVWQAQAVALQSRYDVHVVSFPGFASIGAMAKYVLERAPDRFSLAGHSMGGRVALEIYRRAPERIVRLALLDTGCDPVAEGEAEKRGVLVAKALADGMAAVAETWARRMIAPDRQHDAELLGRILLMVGRMSGEIYRCQTRALLDRPDASTLLPTIECPTLLLCGEQDAWSPPESHRRMAAAIPRAQLRLIGDCGHMSTMERPQQVLAAIVDWMREPVAASSAPDLSPPNESRCG